MIFFTFAFILGFKVLEASTTLYLSEMSKFLVEIERNLSSNSDISSSLIGFNLYNDIFRTHISTIDPKKLQVYILTKERAVHLISPCISKSFWKRTNLCVSDFVTNLLKDVKDYSEMFSTDKITEIMNFVIANVSHRNNDMLTDSLPNLVLRLSPDQFAEFLSETIKNPVCKVFSSSIVEAWISMLSTEENPDPVQILDCLKSCAGLEVSNQNVVTLIKLVDLIDFEENPEWFNPIISALKKISIKRLSDPHFLKVFVNVMLTGSVGDKLLDNFEEHNSLAFLIYFASSQSDSFEAWGRTANLSPKMRIFYETCLEKFSVITSRAEMLKQLSGEISKENIRSACRILEEFRGFAANDLLFAQILQADLVAMGKHLTALRLLVKDPHHPLVLDAWKLNFHFGLLTYELYADEERRNAASSNIVLGVGNILSIVSGGNNFPTDLISEYLQIFDDVVDRSFRILKTAVSNMKMSTLKQLMLANNIHPLQAKRSSVNDRLLSLFISKCPGGFNHFSSVRSFSLVKPRDVYLTAFFTFLKDYNETKLDSNLEYLREFYLFLQNSDLLSKTEILIIDAKYRKFRI